mgnify:CR=1 FL=1
MIKVDLTGAAPFFDAAGPDYASAASAHRMLEEKSGPGAEITGWIELPRMYDAREVRLFTEGGLVRTEEFPHRDGFIYEVEAFGRLLAGGTDAVVEAPPEDTCAALGMIEEALTQLRGSCG